MAFIGIELNDLAITGVANEQVVFSEPGCATVEGGKAEFGDNALCAAHLFPRTYFDSYWHDLSEKPVSTGLDALATHADFAHAQLERLWDSAADGDVAGFAVPSYWDRDRIALLLGICEEIGIPVEGIAEIPVAATRRSYPGYNLVHLEMFAHVTTLSPIEQTDGSSVSQNKLVDGVGAVSLRRASAEFFAQRFLECSRFDPLHDAESEQSLYDHLGNWLAQSRSGVAELELASGDAIYKAEVSAGQLAASLRRHCQPLLQALRSHLQQEQGTVLQMDPYLLTFPGLVELFDDMPGCVSFVLEADAAARGLAARESGLVRQAGGVVVCTRLPWDQAPAEVESGRVSAANGVGAPSHVVQGSMAYRLGETPLRIGTETLDGEYGLTIDRRHSGVSRRHCGIEIDGGCAVLSDYSRYGTRLNGHKIDGSVVLQAGDVVSLGDPPCELKLIAEAGPDGT